MKLYHGTTAAAIPAILGTGILPRTPEQEGNWTACPSKTGYAYLTTAYALYFACCASTTGGPDAEEDMDAAADFALNNGLALVEVDSERLCDDWLCPDEDFVAQAIMQNRAAGHYTGDKQIDKIEGLRELTNAIEPANFAHLWKLSLEKFGSVAHIAAVPPNAITRYAVLNPVTAAAIIGEAMEPTITIANYCICGAYYRDLLAFVFGDRQEPPLFRYADANLLESLKTTPETEKAIAEHMTRNRAALLEARALGVTVVDVST